MALHRLDLDYEEEEELNHGLNADKTKSNEMDIKKSGHHYLSFTINDFREMLQKKM